MLKISTGFAFVPQLLATAGIKTGFSLFDAYLKAFAVHISHREHFFGVIIGYDGGNKSPIVKFKLVQIYHSLTSIPASLRAVLSCFIFVSP